MYGDETLRVLGLMLLAGASVANASEHHRQVWNAPEARCRLHAAHPTRHMAAARRLSAIRSTKTKPSHVAACVPTPTRRAHARRAVRVNAGPHVRTYLLTWCPRAMCCASTRTVSGRSWFANGRRSLQRLLALGTCYPARRRIRRQRHRYSKQQVGRNVRVLGNFESEDEAQLAGLSWCRAWIDRHG